MASKILKYFVSVLPNSKYESVEVIGPDILRVKVHAKPIDGEANLRLVEILAKHFDVAKSCVDIQAGQYFRKKVVKITLN